MRSDDLFERRDFVSDDVDLVEPIDELDAAVTAFEDTGTFSVSEAIADAFAIVDVSVSDVVDEIVLVVSIVVAVVVVVIVFVVVVAVAGADTASVAIGMANGFVVVVVICDNIDSSD